MKETIITKIIPETHRNLLIFLAVIFAAGFFTFIALLEGIRVDRLKLAGVTVEQLYLKWEDALHIRATKIDLSGLQSEETPLTLEPLSKLPPFIRHFERWVSEVDVESVVYRDLNLSVRYRKHRPGRIDLRYGDLTTGGNFSLDERSFRLELPRTYYNGAEITTKVRINLQKETFVSDVTLQLPKTPPIRASVAGDRDRLYLSVRADAPITDVEPIVSFFDLDPNVRPWIVQAARYSSVSLQRLSGDFAYAAPEELLQTLYAQARVDNAHYTFAEGIRPIDSPTVNLLFKRGRLNIVPQAPTFHAIPAERSWLYIDFTTPHTMLEAFIRSTQAPLGDPILNLLQHYAIHLPLRQQSGTCAVDLNLSINLFDLNTTAAGTFRPSPSELLFNRVPLHSEGGIVRLERSLVSFEGFSVRYGNGVAHAAVRGHYDTHTERGEVRIDADRVSPAGNPSPLTLKDPKSPLRVTYAIRPDGDTLSVAASQWSLMGRPLSLGAFTTPFDYHRAAASFPAVTFSYADTAKGTVQTDFDAQRQHTALRLKLDQYASDDLSLSSAPLEATLTYDGRTMRAQTPNASAWSIHRVPFLLSPFSVTMAGDTVSFSRVETVVDDVLKANVTGKYDLSTKKGTFRLANLLPLKPKLAPYIDPRQSLTLFVDASGERFVVNAPSFNTRFTTIPDGWQISLADISLVSRRSPLLRRYRIDNGHMDLIYTGKRSLYNFSGEIDYPYAVMMVNDEPVNRYRFTGTYQEGQTMIRVNNRVTIDHTDTQTEVKANNAGINMPELFRFLSATPDSASDGNSSGETPYTVSIKAAHTYLYLMERRKIIADTLDATLEDENFDATLDHAGGHATLKIRNGFFSINGSGFNDHFMDHLFAMSDFDGGAFSFQAKGSAEAFDGIMRVENTIMKDYKLLNNVLAFVNTIPSLATFSLPNYHTKGLPVSEGYAHFTYNKGKVGVDNMMINSPEMKLAGETRADLNTNALSGTMTLKTDLGSKLSKVPMVGYILFGKDGSVSTTVTISGTIDDPKIQTGIAKEIVTAPFNILKRTLVYPFMWMIDDDEKR